MNELMESVSTHYSKLKDASAGIQRNGDPENIVIEPLMEASVATNFAIQQVTYLEQVFVLDNPHLNTVYRMFANLILVESIQELTAVVTAKSPLASQFSEKNAVEFLGDVMECSFRNPSDPYNKSNSLVTEFLEQWQFPNDTPIPLHKNSLVGETSSVQHIFSAAEAVAKLEVPIEPELNCPARRIATNLGLESHSWLPNSPYIGKNRSITHTIRLIQALSNIVEDQKGRLFLREGSFGQGWSRRKKPVPRMQIDMDDLLMNYILPSLINMCSEGLISKNLPYQEELFTGFAQVKSFVKIPERPVSWSLAFTVY